jgi:hypothetical protein
LICPAPTLRIPISSNTRQVSPVARAGRYRGFFGHTPLVNFEDKNDIALQTKVKEGTIIPGQANPPGYFCSPDSIASFTDSATGETYIAIADQCNYRLVIYRWTDIRRAIESVGGASVTPSTAAAVPPSSDRNILPADTPAAKVSVPTPSPAPRKKRPVRPVYRERKVVIRKSSDSKASDSKEQEKAKKKKKQKP